MAKIRCYRCGYVPRKKDEEFFCIWVCEYGDKGLHQEYCCPKCSLKLKELNVFTFGKSIVNLKNIMQ